ncbi:MAG: hypothetical protein ACM3ZS_10580, partial [Nitrososphaerota archaeon]
MPNGGSTTSTSITFNYSEPIDNQPQVDLFKCRLDGSGMDPFVDCTNFIPPGNFFNTITYNGLSLGMHTFEVQACLTPGPNEICDETPATWTWFVVDFDTFITSAVDSSDVDVAQNGTTNYDDIIFTFSDNNNSDPITVDGFECSLDFANFTDCTTDATKSYFGLAAGNHTFQVRAFIILNNIQINDSTPAVWNWTITTDTVIDTAIDSSDVDVAQNGTTNYDDITFTYHATVLDDDNPDTPVNATADGFVCSLDFAMFEDCTMDATKSYTNLTAGNHTFMVSSFVFDHTGMAILDPTPAVWNWTITTDTVIDTAMDGDGDLVLNDTGSTSSNDITFTYHATVLDDYPDNSTVMTTADGFECSLDFAMFEDCTAGATKSYTNLTAGNHTFMVTSFVFDHTGMAIFDPTPAVFKWNIKQFDTVILSAIDGDSNSVLDGGSTPSKNITFTFQAIEVNTLQLMDSTLQINTEDNEELKAPFNSSKIEKDNSKEIPNSLSSLFKLVIPLFTYFNFSPLYTAQSLVSPVIAQEIFNVQPGLQCMLDDGPFEDCSTGTKNYPDLSAGQHVFKVRWNISDTEFDPSPANFTWTVEPDTIIDSAVDGNGANVTNGGSTNSSFINFTFH